MNRSSQALGSSPWFFMPTVCHRLDNLTIGENSLYGVEQFAHGLVCIQ